MVTKLNTIFTAFGYTVTQYDSDDVVDAYIRDPNYGIDTAKICFGVSF